MNEQAMKDNPLLLLITVHAYAINDLDVEPEIKALIINNKEQIKRVNPEAAYNELKKIMSTNHPERYIREFKELFFEFIPGLKITDGFKQNNPWHIYDVFEHTMHVMENTSTNSTLRMAALFHDLGKPAVYREETKKTEEGKEYQVGHFYGHAKASLVYFDSFADTLNISQKERETISKLIVYHDYNLSIKPEKMKKYIEDLGAENIPLLFELKRADNLAQNPALAEKILKELAETEKIFMDFIKKLEQPKEENHVARKK